MIQKIKIEDLKPTNYNTLSIKIFPGQIVTTYDYYKMGDLLGMITKMYNKDELPVHALFPSEEGYIEIFENKNIFINEMMLHDKNIKIFSELFFENFFDILQFKLTESAAISIKEKVKFIEESNIFTDKNMMTEGVVGDIVLKFLKNSLANLAINYVQDSKLIPNFINNLHIAFRSVSQSYNNCVKQLPHNANYADKLNCYVNGLEQMKLIINGKESICNQVKNNTKIIDENKRNELYQRCMKTMQRVIDSIDKKINKIHT